MKLSASMRLVQTPRSRAACFRLSVTVVALIDAEQAFGIGHAERPRRHQHPVDDGEQGRHDQEEIDRPGHRRVQFLDAVPLVTGGHVAGVWIAFFYRHG